MCTVCIAYDGYVFGGQAHNNSNILSTARDTIFVCESFFVLRCKVWRSHKIKTTCDMRESAIADSTPAQVGQPSRLGVDGRGVVCDLRSTGKIESDLRSKMCC